MSRPWTSAHAKRSSTAKRNPISTQKRLIDRCKLHSPVPIEIITDVGLSGKLELWAPPMVIPIASLPLGYTSTRTICYSPGIQAFTLGAHPLNANYEKRKVICKSAKMEGFLICIRLFASPSENFFRRSWYKFNGRGIFGTISCLVSGKTWLQFGSTIWTWFSSTRI